MVDLAELDSAAWLAGHRLTSLPAVLGGGSEVAFTPAQTSQECGAELPILSARGQRRREGEALVSPRHWERGWEETHLWLHKSRSDCRLENPSKTRAVCLPPLPKPRALRVDYTTKGPKRHCS